MSLTASFFDAVHNFAVCFMHLFIPVLEKVWWGFFCLFVYLIFENFIIVAILSILLCPFENELLKLQLEVSGTFQSIIFSISDKENVCLYYKYLYCKCLAIFFAHIGLSMARTDHLGVPAISGNCWPSKRTSLVVQNWLRGRTSRLVLQGVSRGTLEMGSGLNTKELLEGLKLSGS